MVGWESQRSSCHVTSCRGSGIERVSQNIKHRLRKVNTLFETHKESGRMSSKGPEILASLTASVHCQLQHFRVLQHSALPEIDFKTFHFRNPVIVMVDSTSSLLGCANGTPDRQDFVLHLFAIYEFFPHTTNGID